MRAAAWPGARDDLGHAVARQSAAATVHPARERRVVGEEAGDLRHDAAGEAEGAHVRPAAWPGPGDHVREPVTRHVAARHEHAAGEERVVGVEAGELRDACRREP